MRGEHDVDATVGRVARVPGGLITTASADVALKGLSYLLEAMAKLRTERDVTLTIIGKPMARHSDVVSPPGLVITRSAHAIRRSTWLV